MAPRKSKISTGPETEDLFRIPTAKASAQAEARAASAIPDDRDEETERGHLDDANPVKRQALLPNRRPEDLLYFLIEPLEVVLKDDMASMESPIYSLSKSIDTTIIRYEHNGNWLEIVPSVKGRATIYDKDLILYCTSHIVRAVNEGRPVSPTIRFSAYDFLQFANRTKSGVAYNSLRDTLVRLNGTRITTNIVTGKERHESVFGLIEHGTIISETRDGRMKEIEVKLSEWVFRGIANAEVLTLHQDYFRLRRPLERRLYELARKHCGSKEEWAMSMELCMKKAGSKGPLKEFRRMVREIVEDNEQTDHFPDYSVAIEGDSIVFRRKARAKLGGRKEPAKVAQPKLNPDSYAKARAVAPGWDVYALEAEWIEFWNTSGRPEFKSADAAFIGFCKSRARDQKR
ncbi:replication initiator protein A [Asticcacaulis excentricus]|uniref:Replication initiator protein A n=1 Tax=Asticcacaulis excentricus (strain ATCC 15261 / DSM 4724 / KCTC 12464 / NCIMB 9791 / VKM B-1370 / CB 48) TaxID=573065 RepID=E8RVW5_ASTEC|nr:replication initiator protein A [Asticcacaulis excentricus]ADU15387.1 Replication initiator protein A [Asticcacaulis excentricus CB 48]